MARNVLGSTVGWLTGERFGLSGIVGAIIGGLVALGLEALIFEFGVRAGKRLAVETSRGGSASVTTDGLGARIAASALGMALVAGVGYLGVATFRAFEEEALELPGIGFFLALLAGIAAVIAYTVWLDLSHGKWRLALGSVVALCLGYAIALGVVDDIGRVYFEREAGHDDTSLDYLGTGLRDGDQLRASEAGTLFGLILILPAAVLANPLTLCLAGIRQVEIGDGLWQACGVAAIGGAIAGGLAGAVVTASEAMEAAGRAVWLGVLVGGAATFALSWVATSITAVGYRLVADRRTSAL